MQRLTQYRPQLVGEDSCEPSTQCGIVSIDHRPDIWRWLTRQLSQALFLFVSLACLANVAHAVAPACERTITASVVALEQVFTYNRFGAFNPNGMIYALKRDVVPIDPTKGIIPGNVQIRADKRPRPIILRVNEGDCLEVTFTNLLSPQAPQAHKLYKSPATGESLPVQSGRPQPVEPEFPRTRAASMHVNGLNYVGGTCPDGTKNPICADGAFVGNNPKSTVEPGETAIYKWYGKKEGGYFLYSMAAPAGGEGDGGQIGPGLFGSVNVEPRGAIWYRSQVTARDLQRVKIGENINKTPRINYEAHDNRGTPILNMLDHNEIIHTDLNAVIELTQGEYCGTVGPGSSCGKSFREFTSIFHDENTTVQAFTDLADENNPISGIRDNMAINYGAAGMGAPVLASRKGQGPAAKCAECKFEEFFLSSWANGDPAMNVRWRFDSKTGKPLKAVEALYPDDPSNVHHSYLGDAVRFRNLHAGPKETHVFHLHAHQWVQDKYDPDSVYLDSQTISPGGSFSYEIHYGGSGNRNLTPGDSIFHCHLYPHFAQGMWELWRTHDVFEDGSPGSYDPSKAISSINHPGMRNLPDGEIGDGTPNPALVPVPGIALPPMPSKDFRGYPFYIAGEPGHRPPQPPYDIEHDGGLQRHVVQSGIAEDGTKTIAKSYLDTKDVEKQCDETNPAKPKIDPTNLYDKGRKHSLCIASNVARQNTSENLTSPARKLKTAKLKLLDPKGEPGERRAMDFHAGKKGGKDEPGVSVMTGFEVPVKGYPSFDSAGQPGYFLVNGMQPQPGAPYADPCPKKYKDGDGAHHDVHMRNYRAAYIQFDMTVNKAGWHDPQARAAVLEEDVKDTLNGTRAPEPFFFRANSGECITFAATNLIPSNLNLDDFQIFSPTDVIGQHIHLVKFDVTSSDGSGNGWNYEDGTLSADEIRERIFANNAYVKDHGGKILHPAVHPMFKPNGAMKNDSRGLCPANATAEELEKNHPWCGAQTTVQRWWVDPLHNRAGKDRTLRTVFTHDHFGPSSHQHHGLYAALVIEPTGTKWETLDGKTQLGGAKPDGKPLKLRRDGGPTSYAANIIFPTKQSDENKREFNLAFADFAIVYDAKNAPINPPNRDEQDLPELVAFPSKPKPEGISGGDPGTQLINYRNEPIALRISEDVNGSRKQKEVIGQTTEGACKFVLDHQNLACRVKNAQDCKARKDFEKSCGLIDPAQCEREDIIAFTNVTTCGAGDLANAFSSLVHGNQTQVSSLKFPSHERDGVFRKPGDPATPLLFAYDGDKVLIRLIQGGQEEQHVFNMHGAKWLSQPDSRNSGWVDAQQIGISEHFEFNVKFGTGLNRWPTDYLYSSAATDNLWDGQWGLLRAFSGDTKKDKSHKDNLKPLPGTESPPSNPLEQGIKNDVCQGGELDVNNHPIPLRTVEVSAWFTRNVYNNALGTVYNERFKIADPNGIIFLKDTEKVDDKTASDQPQRPLNPEPLILRAKKERPLNPEPLILRAKAGECVKIIVRNCLGSLSEAQCAAVVPAKDRRHAPPLNDGLTSPSSWSWNMLPPIVRELNFNDVTMSNRVGLHLQLLANNAFSSDGSNIGVNLDSTVGPGEDPKHLSWYAGNHEFKKNHQGKWEDRYTPMEFGVVAIRDMADVIKHSSHGAIGALVIEPEGSIWQTDANSSTCDPKKNPEPLKCTHASATVTKPNGDQFREFVLLYQDDLSLQQHGVPMFNIRGGDDSEDSGQKAFNYRTEPIWARLGLKSPAAELEQANNRDLANVFSSVAHGDPETPIFRAQAGMPVRFRVVHPAGHPRQHAFAVFGHDWQMQSWECDSDSTVMGWNQYGANRIGAISGIGPTKHHNILTTAGGDFHIPGDYMYRSQESFQFNGGLWGIFRVENEGSWRDAIPGKRCSVKP